MTRAPKSVPASKPAAKPAPPPKAAKPAAKPSKAGKPAPEAEPAAPSPKPLDGTPAAAPEPEAAEGARVQSLATDTKAMMDLFVAHEHEKRSAPQLAHAMAAATGVMLAAICAPDEAWRAACVIVRLLFDTLEATQKDSPLMAQMLAAVQATAQPDGQAEAQPEPQAEAQPEAPVKRRGGRPKRVAAEGAGG